MYFMLKVQLIPKLIRLPGLKPEHALCRCSFSRIRLKNRYMIRPLIPYLLNCEIGICKGREALRILIQKVAERKPPLRKYYRKRFFTDGDTLMWEYPRSTPTGEQMDFVEVMELKNGLIWYHRVYWGWLGVKVIKEDQYRR